MAQPAPTPARKAKAKLEQIDAKVVSVVDKPAIGTPFVVRKSADGAEDTEDETAKAAPPPVPPPAGDPQVAAQEKVDPEGEQPATLSMPAEVKAGLLGGLTDARARLDGLLTLVQGATEAPDAEVPAEPLTAVADIAVSLASMVEPFVGKGFGGTTDAEPAEGGAVAKAVGWSQEYIDSLSDGCFLYVEPSGEHDNDWRTLPLANRHFPIRDHAWRLHVPALIDAVEQVSTTTAAWLSETRKRQLLLRLASERLDEAMIPVRRDETPAPEVVAELTAVADLVAQVAQMIGGAPAAAAQPDGTVAPPPSAGEEGTVQAAAPPTLDGVSKRVAEQLKAIAKMAGGERGDALCAAVKGAADMLAKAADDYAKMADGAQAEVQAAAPPPPAVPPPATDPAQKAVTEAVTKAVDDATATLRKELGALKASSDKLATNLADTRARLAKAERAAPAPNSGGADLDQPATPVAKASSEQYPPLNLDLAEHFAKR